MKAAPVVGQDGLRRIETLVDDRVGIERVQPARRLPRVVADDAERMRGDQFQQMQRVALRAREMKGQPIERQLREPGAAAAVAFD